MKATFTHFIRNVPIKRKLTLITMLTSGMALVLACVAFAVYEQVDFRKSMVTDLTSMAEMIGNNSSGALSFNDPASAEQTLKSLSADPHIVGGAIYDKDGKPFARYQRTTTSTVVPLPAARSEGYSFRWDGLELFHTIELAGEGIGTVYLESDLEEISDRLHRYVGISVAVTVVASFVAFLLSRKLRNLVSAPISHLAGVVRQVAAAKNYSLRAVSQSEDELGQLIDGFNEMLSQIQTRDAELQRGQEMLEMRVAERTRELKEEVTERQRSETALRESNDRFQIVTRATNDVIWDWNLETSHLWWSKNFQVLFGYEEGGADNEISSWTSKIHPDDATTVEQSVQNFLGGSGQFWSGEYRLRRHDGTYAFVFDRGYALRDAEGRAHRMIGAIQDITERKEADEMLRNSEHRYRQIIHALPGAVYTCDAEGRITLFNEAAVALWGRKPEVGPDRWCGSWRIYQPDGTPIPRASCPTAMAIKQGQPIRGREMIIERPDGSRAYVLPHPDPIRDAYGTVVGAVTMMVDLSERKSAEIKLEEVHRQLVDTSRRAGMAEVATGVLHNVGNVLNSVNVSTTVLGESLRKSKASNLMKVVALLRDHEGDLGTFITADPKGKQLPAYLTQLGEHLVAEQSLLLGEVEQLSKNIEHIKDIVAMQQNYAKQGGLRETVQIIDLVEDALRINLSALERHGVKIHRDYGNIPAVTADKHKILQILVNLIRNAKYACDVSEQSEKRMTIRARHEVDRVILEVIDNGVGIPTENLTRIFGHGFTTRKDGHGFGLHSGALAAKEMGGSLRVHSDGIGRGAIFTLEFPCEVPTPLAA